MADHAQSAAPRLTLSADEAVIVRLIQMRGPLSRAQLAEASGYSRAKIAAIVGRLLDDAVLAEVVEGESSGGRRPRLLGFPAGGNYVVGVDIGATSLDLALADFAGQIVRRAAAPADVRDGPEPVLTQVKGLIREMLEATGIAAERVHSIGIGVPGPVEFSSGLLIAPPIMPGWEAYPIRSYMAQDFPAARVVVDNDVNIMALGELRGGDGPEDENFIFVKVGTGIGAGIVCQGQVYRGSTGCAGDIGHICADPDGPICHCGNVGCLEAMAAGPAIARLARQAVQEGRSPALAQLLEAHGTLTAELVGVAAAQGDAQAMQIIQQSGRLIGDVLAALVNFYNPNRIIIGGGVSNIGFHFLNAIRRAVLARSLPLSTRHLQIQYSTLKGDAGVIGAIALALEHMFVIEA
ncbi:MAG: ROK family transcriptional regulator [Anaerolineae bacterium]